MTDMKVLTPRAGVRWKAEATAAIVRLEASAAFRTPLAGVSCTHADPPGLVVRLFHFKGKGRDWNVAVKLHAKAMVGLLKAMRKCPSIQITQPYTSAFSGCYREYQQQWWLRDQYLHHGGHLAADPCDAWHRTGRAGDLYLVTGEERETMLSVRVGIREVHFFDLLPQDPPHFVLGVRA